MSEIVSSNEFVGLWRGPVDFTASTVIGTVLDAGDPEEISLLGEAVFTKPPPPDQILPHVMFIGSLAEELLFYGIVVGGDRRGVYAVGGESISFNLDSPQVVAFAGDGVKICTQGRCIANVDNVGAGVMSFNPGDPLKPQSGGHLTLATSGSRVVARALQQLDVPPGDAVGFMAVDLQREGFLP